MENIELYDRVIESYAKTSSVKKTAEELGISVIKVRRVLITEGLWSSPTSEKIIELHKQGYSTAEIANMLHYTEKNVQAFLPYIRGTYWRENKSQDSVRSKEYRERNQRAAENQVGSSEKAPQGYIRDEAIAGQANENQGKHPYALKLHLELDLEGCTEEDMHILRKHGKVEKSISRDIVVPSDITLHSLHYAIQRLFGWQNAHLHHYAFPDEVFQRLTQNSFSRWCSLAGIYFRFPSEELDDLFWDEDYEANMSIKSWFKSKYKGPYHYGGLGDYYLVNQHLVQLLKQDLPSFEVRESFEEYMKRRKKTPAKPIKTISIEDATLEEFQNSDDLGGELNYLLERLTLPEYLYLPGNTWFLDSLDGKIDFLEDEISVAMDAWNTSLSDIDNQYETFCLLAAMTTVRKQAQSDRIEYFYDYGDGWQVSITLTDVYYQEDLKIEELDELLWKVAQNQMPVCVGADGLPVMDDVGGVGGYADFLRLIHYSADQDEKENAREWARSVGWTGRMIKPENML